MDATFTPPSSIMANTPQVTMSPLVTIDLNKENINKIEANNLYDDKVNKKQYI